MDSGLGTHTGDIADMVSLWRTLKMMSPLILMILAGLGGLMVHYLRSISLSMRTFHVDLAKILQHIEHHRETLEEHNERLAELEQTRRK
jgi:hypothetical protein